jgi:hypothetical protein
MKFLSALFAATGLASCITDLEVLGKDEYVTMSEFHIGTRAPGADEAIDREIKKLRMIVFDAGNDQIRDLVIKTGDALEQTTFSYIIAAGDYHFFFVANEPAASSAALNAVTSVADLDRIAFPAEGFSGDLPIPMVQEFTSVTVRIENNSVTVNGVDEGDTWDLLLVRMGIRLDGDLVSGVDVASKFTGVTISNLPDRVPLTKGYDVSAIQRNGTRNYAWTETEQSPRLRSLRGEGLPTGAFWQLKIDREILPANIMPASSPPDPVRITLHGVDDPAPSTVLKVTDDGEMPVNYHLTLTGNVSLPVELGGMYVHPVGWTDESVAGTSGKLRRLHVSEIEGSASSATGASFTFWSNMPDVRFRGMTPTQTEGTFNLPGGLTVEFTYNYVEDSDSGSGKATIKAGNASASQTPYTLWLEAAHLGNDDEPLKPLAREIKVTVN